PQSLQPATNDSTWDPDADTQHFGGREYLFVVKSAYDANAKPDLASARLNDGSLPLEYVLTAMKRTDSDVIDPGDRFVFRYGIPPPTNLDGLMFRLTAAAPGDSISQRLRDIVACLQPVNNA